MSVSRKKIIIFFMMVFLVISPQITCFPVRAMEEFQGDKDKEESTSDADLDKHDQSIIEGLKNKGIIQGETTIKGITPESAAADRIIFVTIKGKEGTCKRVAKTFKDIEEYEMEKNSIPTIMQYRKIINKYRLQYMEMVNQYKIQCEIKLPLLVEYEGSEIINQKGVVLMSKAKGKNLKQFFDPNIKNDPKIKSIDDMDDERIQKMFMTIGQQMGTLISMFYKDNDGMILRHPDNSGVNYMYDEKNGQLYWIDLAGVKLTKYSEYYNEKSILRFAGQLFLSTSTGWSNNPILDKFRDQISQNNIAGALGMLKKHIFAYNTLYDSYINEVKNLENDREKTVISIKESVLEDCLKVFQEALLEPVIKPVIKAIQSGDIKTVKNYLDMGLFVDAKDENQMSLLHRAVMSRKIDIINLLLKEKAKVNTKNKSGVSPLGSAIIMKNETIKSLLREHGAKD